MPNWCYNKVSITNNSDDNSKLQKVKEFLYSDASDDTEENVFDFNNVVPEPKEAEDWYMWRVNSWGTKWNSSCAEITYEDEETVEYQFDTAWSPPEPIILQLREKFGDDVHISAFYDEPSMEFAGYL